MLLFLLLLGAAEGQFSQKAWKRKEAWGQDDRFSSFGSFYFPRKGRTMAVGKEPVQKDVLAMLQWL